MLVSVINDKMNKYYLLRQKKYKSLQFISTKKQRTHRNRQLNKPEAMSLQTHRLSIYWYKLYVVRTLAVHIKCGKLLRVMVENKLSIKTNLLVLFKAYCTLIRLDSSTRSFFLLSE